jgi:hypothetical protein
MNKLVLYTSCLLVTLGFSPRNAGVTFSAGFVDAQSGNPVTVPVLVGSFVDVATAQFTLEWDAAVLQLNSVDGFGLPGLN